jgi:beta-xylosidase
MPSSQFTNPVWSQDFPDPHVLAHQGRYYAYATETRRHGSGFQVMESRDLVHWTHRGTAFTPPWSKEHLWAPEVIAYRGQFYMTFSAKGPRDGKHHIGIATAKSPLGPFQNQTMLVRGDHNRIGVIDATIFVDSDGTPFILYSEETPRRIVVRRLSADLMTAIGPPQEVMRPDRPRERGVVEAPTLIKRGKEYILFFSAGVYESNKSDASYGVYYARASRITGPYVKGQRALLQTIPGKIYGPGHQCVVRTPDDGWWMLYHGWNAQNEPRYGSNPLGRTLRLDRLRWEENTPFITRLTLGPTPSPKV